MNKLACQYCGTPETPRGQGEKRREVNERLFGRQEPPMSAPDPVNKPNHYNQHPSGVECITIVQELSYNCGVAVAYIWRSPHKGSQIEDLKKAIRHLEFEVERLSK